MSYLLQLISKYNIKQLSELQNILSKEPYYIQCKIDNNYMLLMYTGFNSFKDPNAIKISTECRGIILYQNNNKIQIVCYPFDKFWNFGEKYAANIDWNTVQIQEKLDGSIIKFWKHNGILRISTNSCIDAKKASTPSGRNYFDLVIDCLTDMGTTIDNIEPYILDNHTYIFELLHKDAKIIISYDTNKLVHIGTRNNLTLEEVHHSTNILNISKPVLHNFNHITLEDIISFVNSRNFSYEGVVIVDDHYNRLKIKGKDYVTAHHLRLNVGDPYLNAIKIVLNDEISEFLVYFPDKKYLLESVHKDITAYIQTIIDLYNTLMKYSQRKDWAIEVNRKNPSLMKLIMTLYTKFQGNEIENFHEIIWNLLKEIPIQNIATILKNK